MVGIVLILKTVSAKLCGFALNFAAFRFPLVRLQL
jgi:hypothetical protein